MTPEFLSLDTQVETGPVHFTFLGDEGSAKRYVYEARKFLAFTKSQYGVYDRMSQGVPGGFYHAAVELPDGTKISITTNDGIDTAVITGPIREEVRKEDKEEHEFEPPIGPGFFVGVRYVQGGLPVRPRSGYQTVESDAHYDLRHVVPHLCLWVPDRKGQDTDERLVVSNRNTLLGIDPNDDDQFSLGGFVSRPHYDDSKQFPLGIYKSSNWVVREGVLQGDTYWDVLITHKAQPPSGMYDVKVCAVSADCLVLTPVEFEVVMVLGQLTARKKFVIKEFSAATRQMMPKGFFWQSGGGSNKEDWYYENDSASFGNTNVVYAYGPNPHGPNWWPGGVRGYLDHEPRRSKNKSYLNAIDSDQDGKPFIINGFFEPDSEVDYSDPRGFYKFTGPYSGFPPLNDRCTDAVGTSTKRQWAELPLSVAGQNVAVSSARLCTAECAAKHAEPCGESLGTQVFLNLGSSNENDLQVDIPGVAEGVKVTFTSVRTNRTIIATVKRLPGSVIGAGIKIGTPGVSCVYGIIDLSDSFDPQYDNELTDYFYASFVTTTTTTADGNVFYYRITSVNVVVDNPFSADPLDTNSESGAFPFLEQGAGVISGPETFGYHDLLEKFWAAGK